MIAFRKTRPFAAALAALALTIATGCRIVNGSGSQDEQTIELDTDRVDTIEVHSGFELHAEIGTSHDVRILGDDNLLSEVMVRTVDNRLQIDWADSAAIYGPSGPMVVEVQVPELVLLQASGGSTVRVGVVDTPRLTVETSGGGSTRFEAIDSPDVSITTSGGGEVEVQLLIANELRATSSGGGSWRLAGLCPELALTMSGGGHAAAFELEVSSAHLDLSGGGSAQLLVADSLTGAASGGAAISLRGDPQINVGLSGGSAITPD